MRGRLLFGSGGLLLLANPGCHRREVEPAPSATEAPPALSEAEALNDATDAYVFGYPLVTMDMTREVLTNVATPGELAAPMGQFANLPTFPGPSFKAVTTPNADTLYSSAWVDVGREPMVLSVPAMGDRYHLLPILSAWTDVIASPGTRTTGGGAQELLITGPGWTGTVPAGLTRVESPTATVWIIGRIYSTGTPKDLEAVHALQSKLRLAPLSAYGTDYTPPAGEVDANVDMQTAVRDQVEALDGKAFFTRLARLMARDAPAEADAPMLARMAKIGIEPGRPFDPQGVVADAVADAPRRGLAEIAAHASEAGRMADGWTVSTDTGDYGTDYLQRAYVARVGLGANLPQDAVYPAASVDSEGRPLDGNATYVLHFGAPPPAKAFWSVSMYDAEHFFVANPLERYSLGSRDKLKRNRDGSFDVYVQSTSPGRERESNWLPAPAGPFNLVMRLYMPEQAVLDGTWSPPAVQRVEGPS